MRGARSPAAKLAVSALATVLAATFIPAAHAQQGGTASPIYLGSMMAASGVQPVTDNQIFSHLLLNQLEDRSTGSRNRFRWEGQGWIGTDYDRLWLKSEGNVNRTGTMSDGRQEALYGRAISTYFDLQAGVRTDLDSSRGRTWAALGVQGLAVYWFDLEATVYASDSGHFAARLEGSYDLLITQRLILQPQAELNFYSKDDRGRGVGSGLSSFDTGLRLRYEISRKFAPYVGVTYEERFGHSADFARREGERAHDLRFVFGARIWF
ncbi:copper resistance protein B [Dankookia rubra]|uniref:Copper resistance protein B n=1 Tax=Dankookia rubra TaxID=1442381 RepID=A0A4R5QGP0_9PROT|nr:copper resistance protein B [Dankookia rubra]TDH62093.1 copper resistance protein B [Dankookia rubra]